MRVKIRSRRVTIIEAEVDVESGPREEMLQQGVDIADTRYLWKEVSEELVESEIVSEEGRVPIIRDKKV